MSRTAKIVALSTVAATLSLTLVTTPAASHDHDQIEDELLGEGHVTAQVSDEVLDLLPTHRNTFITDDHVSRALDNYWTQERMDAATPMNATDVSPGDAGSVGPETLPNEESLALNADDEVASAERIVTHPVSATKKLYPINPMPRKDWVNGKLFFTTPGGVDTVCSASAVNSSSKRMIATAAHCLFDEDHDEYNRNVVFKGGYKKRNRPSLSFEAWRLGTLSGYRNNGGNTRGFWSDIGFAAMKTNWRGMKVVEAVGGHGMVVGSKDYTQRIRFIGYPTNYARGKVQRTCVRNSTKLTEKYNGKKYNFLKLSGCNFSGGSSGGPYLVDYDKESGKGYITAVHSWSHKKYDTFEAAPLFRKSAENKYDWVNEKD